MLVDKQCGSFSSISLYVEILLDLLERYFRWKYVVNGKVYILFFHSMRNVKKMAVIKTKTDINIEAEFDYSIKENTSKVFFFKVLYTAARELND